MDVRGIEGDGLGRIVRTRGDAFQVELESGDAPWILRGAVFTVDDGEVTLICGAANWFQYRTEDAPW
jgi:hypothetical protein